MNELLAQLPENTRKRIYLVTIVAGLALGAVNVAYLAATSELPLAVEVVNAVALFLGVPVSAGTARANVSQPAQIVVLAEPEGPQV